MFSIEIKVASYITQESRIREIARTTINSKRVVRIESIQILEKDIEGYDTYSILYKLGHLKFNRI